MLDLHNSNFATSNFNIAAILNFNWSSTDIGGVTCDNGAVMFLKIGVISYNVGVNNFNF